MAVCFAPLFPQSFSLRSALKNTLEKTFSTCIRLHFSAFFILFYFQFLFLRVHERQIISLSYMDISKMFCGGVLQKFFTPLTIIGKLRAVCLGISQNFYIFSLGILKILYLLKIGTKKPMTVCHRP